MCISYRKLFIESSSINVAKNVRNSSSGTKLFKKRFLLVTKIQKHIFTLFSLVSGSVTERIILMTGTPVYNFVVGRECKQQEVLKNPEILLRNFGYVDIENLEKCSLVIRILDVPENTPVLTT